MGLTNSRCSKAIYKRLLQLVKVWLRPHFLEMRPQIYSYWGNLGTYSFPTDTYEPNSRIIEYGHRILSKPLLTTIDTRCPASSLTNHQSTLHHQDFQSKIQNSGFFMAYSVFLLLTAFLAAEMLIVKFPKKLFFSSTPKRLLFWAEKAFLLL